MTQSAPKAPPAVDTTPDQTLVDRVRAGDAAAFELIMRRYNQRLYRIARAILRDPSEAEDVVQEAYVRAYTRLADFNGPDGFGAWLSRIASNEALGRIRKRGRVVAIDDWRRGGGESDDDERGIETMPSPSPGPERLAASAELRSVIEDAIDGLPDDFRAVFVLRAVEGLTVAETAVSLGIVEATVKTRLHRARRLLRERIAARVDATAPGAFAFAGARCDRMVSRVTTLLGLR